MTVPNAPRILYVEDDLTIRLMASEALRDAGFVVLEAGTGDDAMLMLRDPDDVDVLFTDVRLPGTLDGIDLARETRKHYPEMPVLVASGYADQLTDRIRTLQPPMAFMRKPFSLSTMVDTLRELAKR